MDNIKEKLRLLGLSAKEIDVYVVILGLGKGTITDISRKTGIKRTTVYEYIESLTNSGLVYKTVDGKRISYCLENPRKITGLLDEQKRQIEEKKRKMEKVIPELESLYSATFKKPNISFYEGKEGIKKVYQQIFDTHKNIYSMFSPDNLFKLFSVKENHDLLMILYNNGGMLYSLVEKTENNLATLNDPEYKKFIKSKQLQEGFKFETNLLVVDDTVALISFKNLIGVIIKDRAIADLQKNFINFIWKGIR
jgi:sugar-specific transcriptional regulator TrmB